jgi:DnaJ-domain-containing protein 1
MLGDDRCAVEKFSFKSNTLNMIQCPSCARPQEPRLICEQCGNPLAVPADLDCFSALGIPRKLVIDTSSLETAYHDLGRKIHPDRFASSAPNLRALSLAGTALLTRSYRTLRDPISRGLYWLDLNGEKLAENNKNVPPEMAETVFEVQEQLADLRTASGDAALELKNEVGKRRVELSSAMDDHNAQLLDNFARWDASNGTANKTPQAGKPVPQDLVTELKSILSKIAYLRTLLRDIDREFENLKAA